jgi:hypothetical protein
MNWLTSLVGSGFGVIAIAFGFLLLRYHDRAPGITHSWLRRVVIAIMYGGGAALAATGVGRWVDSEIVTVAGWFGGLSSGLIHSLIVVAIMFLLAGTVIGLVWEPDGATAMVAICLPLILSLPIGGVIHQIYLTLNAPAVGLADSLNHWLAG